MKENMPNIHHTHPYTLPFTPLYIFPLQTPYSPLTHHIPPSHTISPPHTPYPPHTLPPPSPKLNNPQVAQLLDEYLDSGDIDEAAQSLQELDLPRYDHWFVKRAVTLAMDRHDREREMVSMLLSALYSEVCGVCVDVVVGVGGC